MKFIISILFIFLLVNSFQNVLDKQSVYSDLREIATVHINKKTNQSNNNNIEVCYLTKGKLVKHSKYRKITSNKRIIGFIHIFNIKLSNSYFYTVLDYLTPFYLTHYCQLTYSLRAPPEFYYI
jgi:hypothetical protein